MKQPYLKEQQLSKDNYKNEPTGPLHVLREISSNSPGKTPSATVCADNQTAIEMHSSGKIMHDIFGVFNY